MEKTVQGVPADAMDPGLLVLMGTFGNNAKLRSGAATAPMPGKGEDCRIFVITLEQAHARQETIAARLAKLNLSCEFCRGVDGRDLDLLSHPDYDLTKRRTFFGRDLSRGEFGCALAHRNIYRQMVEERIPRAVILEDDAIPTDDLPAVIEGLQQIASQWDLVRFLGRPKNYRLSRAILPLTGTRCTLSRPHGIPGGAYGYMLNLHAAERLMAMMEKIWLPIDTLHGAVWLSKLRAFSVVPSPVLPDDEIPSCIDEQDNNARWDKSVRLNGWQRLVYPATRGMWKLYLNCAVRYVRVRTWPADFLRKSRPPDRENA